MIHRIVKHDEKNMYWKRFSLTDRCTTRSVLQYKNEEAEDRQGKLFESLIYKKQRKQLWHVSLWNN